jgi:hypothetical protein
MVQTRRRAVLAIVIAALALPLAGCAAPAADDSGGGATTEAAAESATESAAAPNVVPSSPGDCAFDAGSPGAVTVILTSDDATTPIELTYSAFREGAEPEVRTVTVEGPVVVGMQSDCGSQGSGSWTFTAKSATGDSLGCASFYGGKLLASDSDYAEGDTARGAAVDCSGHPGM